MAACDYKSCDICGCKTYYHAEISYYDNLVKVLCADCAIDYQIIIKKIDTEDEP